jgi:hypothetical protein
LKISALEISTSFVEHQKLAMHMSIRRFTRLTHRRSRTTRPPSRFAFIRDNLARADKTLRIIPEMQRTSLAHVWNYEEITALAN